MIAEDGLADCVAYPMVELDRRENCGMVCGLYALSLMQDMPPSTIETHVDTLVWWMMRDATPGAFIIASTALEVIGMLGPAKLASLKLRKDKIAHEARPWPRP